MARPSRACSSAARANRSIVPSCPDANCVSVMPCMLAGSGAREIAALGAVIRRRRAASQGSPNRDSARPETGGLGRGTGQNAAHADGERAVFEAMVLDERADALQLPGIEDGGAAIEQWI